MTRAVAVDVRRNTWAPQLGISRYSRSLVRAVQALEPDDVLVRPLDVAGSVNWAGDPALHVRPGASLARRAAQEQLDLRRLDEQYDLLHLCWYEGPFRSRRPVVVAVHDLDTIDNADHYRPRFRAYYNSLLRTYVRTAARVLVPSLATEAAVRARWPRARCTVVPLGVDPVFQRTGPAYTGPGSGGRIVAYTGGYNGRKRIADLLAAFEVVSRGRPDVRLVMTGSPPVEVTELIGAMPTSSSVILAGTLDDQALAALYRDASVVVYPSVLEGFGFPVLEAFASGTPVVATATGSIPELAGDAADLVELGDRSGLATAIAGVLDDAGRADRRRAAGAERSRLYGWDRTAQATLACWREVLG